MCLSDRCGVGLPGAGGTLWKTMCTEVLSFRDAVRFHSRGGRVGRAGLRSDIAVSQSQVSVVGLGDGCGLNEGFVAYEWCVFLQFSRPFCRMGVIKLGVQGWGED